MNNKRIRNIVIKFMMICFLLLPARQIKAEDVFTARPQDSGFLHVEGTKIVDEKGNEIVLRGISTHGLTWYSEYVNEELFKQLSEEWNCNLIRLPMYSKIYVEENRAESLKVLETGIKAAISNDMYVLVDWHILEDNDPNIYIKEAEEFFDNISREYANCPNIIYEICNEPNGDTSWEDVKTYSEKIIPIIRKNNPQALIIIGTPEYDQDLQSPINDPLSFSNIMYTLHFYAASHYDGLQSELNDALEAGLPVFITECGISEADGDGSVDFENAQTWFRILDDNKISYAVWSLSNKAETSALIRPESFNNKHISDYDLSYTGAWIKELIKGEAPENISYPEDVDWEQYRSSMSVFTTLGVRGLYAVIKWPLFMAASILGAGLIYLLGAYLLLGKNKKFHTYDDVIKPEKKKREKYFILKRISIFASMVFTLNYFIWRVRYTVPWGNWLAIIANLILLFFEITGFGETLVHYAGMIRMRNHELPKIEEDEYPDVDIFIATYNEDEELLRRTINGCKHLRYPDKDKVHIWVCDDNRRKSMRKLAEKMDVGYFDRPDNSGAKAGNLNAALARTSSPYVVTLDADMIVKSDFLLKTIPYFVNFEKQNIGKEEKDQLHLGFLQTPQCFYDPDVFQHALYSENNVPNEQDFFYRSIEVARTSTNSVIYGGSNTVISRDALNKIGGFYTESITEDYATGILIENAGYISLAIGEPLASGRTPHVYNEHIKQRTRWGRGVIVTTRKLKVFALKGLSLVQKLSYWTSVFYWYSPIKNFIYIVSPLLFAVAAIPVFDCNWAEIFVYWLPMLLSQNITLRLISLNSISSKWSGIYETSVMPAMLIPILKEIFGISLTSFKVTDKSAETSVKQKNYKAMVPFAILLILSFIGLVRVIYLLMTGKMYGLITIIFWLIRNGFFLQVAIFLIDGRDYGGEVVRVRDAEPITVTRKKGRKYAETYEGITTLMCEHYLMAYLDECKDLKIGDSVSMVIDNFTYRAEMKGVITDMIVSRYGGSNNYRIEIVDFGKDQETYFQILYDRIPTLPQQLRQDFGFFNLWRNFAVRLAEGIK